MNKVITLLFILLSIEVVKAQNNTFPGVVVLHLGFHRIVYSPPDTIKNQDTIHKFSISIKIGYHGEDISKDKTDTNKFKFYENPSDQIIKRQLGFYSDHTRIPIVERIVELDYLTWFDPMVSDRDTSDGFDIGEIMLICKSKKGNWLEVIVNEKTQETLWIKKARFVKFIKWENIPKLSSLYLERTPNNKIYNKPDSSSGEIIYNGTNCFEIVKVRREWMKISNTNSELCGVFSGDENVNNVWIRFKTNERFLLKLFF